MRHYGVNSRVNNNLLRNLLNKIYHRRAETIFSETNGYIEDGDTVLDIGAGDCLVAQRIRDRLQADVMIVDVVDYNLTDMRLIKYDGKRLPFPDNTFDKVLLSVVLHHCEDPMTALDEAIRVSKKNIIVIESVFFSTFGKYWSYVIDWYWNRLLHKVPCPLNHKTPEKWESIFTKKGLKIRDSRYLGIDIWYLPEWHYLYYLEK